MLTSLLAPILPYLTLIAAAAGVAAYAYVRYLLTKLKKTAAEAQSYKQAYESAANQMQQLRASYENYIAQLKAQEKHDNAAVVAKNEQLKEIEQFKPDPNDDALTAEDINAIKKIARTSPFSKK